MRGVMAVRLNALLARPQNTLVKLPERIDDALPTLSMPGRFISEAEQQRPLLAVLENKVKAAEANRDLAKKSLYPNFSLAANYGLRSGQNPNGSNRADFFSVMLSVEIQIGRASWRERVCTYV